MKHALLLIVIAIVGYCAFQFADRSERRKARQLITRHGLRLLSLLLIVFLLLAIAVQLPATSLI
ncbi:hypothetical protein [uncultured Aquabacterium sp.]|uniref:hypothetical protein n=1 Tax=uncultured Aquabacterium sp. TaxID=158753 RepID=UPI0025ECF080|nr:hypothetical protein [uncultured Aquabacterium sp.]